MSAPNKESLVEKLKRWGYCIHVDYVINDDDDEELYFAELHTKPVCRPLEPVHLCR